MGSAEQAGVEQARRVAQDASQRKVHRGLGSNRSQG
jgi:hypothetical protein